jgi:hypothetical protein
MSYLFDIGVEKDIVRVKAKGLMDESGAREIIPKAVEKGSDQNCYKFLFDYRELVLCKLNY